MAEQPAAGEPRFVTASDGVQLQHEVVGTGDEWIVFLPGGFAARDTFGRQVRVLADRYRLLLRDLRGHNGSEVRLPPDYSIPTTEVDDTLRVLDAAGIDRTHVIAHSSGGAFAFAFARRHPERIRRLILIEPTLVQLVPEDERAPHVAEFERLRAVGDGGDPVAAAKGTWTHILGAGWDARARPSIVEPLVAAAPLASAHLKALVDHEVTPDDVRALEPPTLYIHGAQSLSLYVAVYHAVGRAKPDQPRLLIEDAGHAVYAQKAARVNQAILEFLAAGELE